MSPRVSLRRYWRLLARYLRPQHRKLAALTSVLLTGVAVRLIGPLFAAAFINQVVDDADTPLSTLIWLALAVCVAGVIDQVCVVAGAHLGSHIAWTATNHLREDVVGHTLTLGLDFHHEYGPGHMIERVDGDARELTNFFSEFAVSLTINLVVIVGVLALMVGIDWRLGLVYFVFAAVAVYTFHRVRGMASPHWRRTREAVTEFYGEAEERFGGLPDIRVNGATGYVRYRFAERLRHLFHRNRVANTWTNVITMGSGLVFALGSIAVLAVGAALFLAGALEIGIVVALVMYTRIISRPLEEIAEQIDDLQRSTASITRLEELLSMEPSVRSGPGVTVPDGASAVAFDDVWFTYPNGHEALRGVSFTLRPGEVLGVVGRTGSGKSTIARLLLRFYDPTRGAITVGGADLRQATLEQLRRQVAVVTQDVQLFHATVRDNLTLFADGVPDAELVDLVREVGLGSWYDRLPDGLDTVLPPGGGLSAGEAQLLAVVRIFVQDPGLVILDEATSRLDAETEATVQRAFDRLLTDRTGVVIAHRLSTLRRADTILMVADGAVREHGARQELEADPSSAYHHALRLAHEDPVTATGGATRW